MPIPCLKHADRLRHTLFDDRATSRAGLNDKVTPGQTVAVQRNSFGEVVAEYTSAVAGEVTGQRSDAMAEPSNPLVFILFHKDAPDRGETYPE